MSELSPAAQAVLDGYNQDPFANTKQSLAAVLRAIELELAYMNDYGEYLINADTLVAIANELEAQ